MTAKKILVAATTNEHKIEEISAIVGSFGYKVISRSEAGVPDNEIEESGDTFEENSLIKARTVFDMLGMRLAVVADDSGIEVDALGGTPGVYSARFAELPSGSEDEFERSGNRCSQDKANNAKLLALLKDVPMERRTAKFVSVITCILPGGKTLACRGEVEGHVGFEETGTEGFGYDPLFIPKGYGQSFGLFSPEKKNEISHRSIALSVLAEKLSEEIVAIGEATKTAKITEAAETK